MRASHSALFLDRDGVLNAPVSREGLPDRSPLTASEVRILPGAKEAVALAQVAGLVPVVVTNQPDITRYSIAISAIHKVNEHISQELPGIAATYMCPHANDGICICRKPLPGMLLAAARDLNLELASSWLIGDRWVDIQAAKSAGVRSILISGDHSWSSTSSGRPPTDLAPTAKATDVLSAVEMVLASLHLKR